MADGAEELEAGEKPWINHKLYTDGFTKHFAVILSQLCERSLVTRVKLCGASEALDCQSVLKEIWKFRVHDRQELSEVGQASAERAGQVAFF